MMEITNEKCGQCQISLNNFNLAKEKISELEKSGKENEKLWSEERKKSQEEIKILQEKLAQFTNFWEICPKKTKTEIIDLLITRMGTPKNDLDNNCLDAVARKIVYFYGEEKDNRSQSVSSLIGKVVEISKKQFKEGKWMGQTYYQLKLEGNIILRARKEDLSVEKWTQIEKLSVLDQKLLFKYRKWIIHRDICDFCPVGTELPNPQSQS